VACFEALGYDNTTTAAIARRAGVAVGTVYGYFGDKRAILLELMDSTVTEIAEHIVQSLDPTSWQEGDPRPSVRTLIDTLFHTRTFNPGMQRIIWERYFKDPDFRAAVERVERRIRAARLNLFQALKARGMLRIDDLETAAFVLYSAIEWTAARLMLGASAIDIDRAVAVTSDMASSFLFGDTGA